MKKYLVVLSIFASCVVGCGIPVQVFAAAPLQLIDSFDDYNTQGWVVPPTPNNTLIPFAPDPNPSDCHSGTCVEANGGLGVLNGLNAGSQMYLETGIGSSTGAFTIWGRARTQNIGAGGSIVLCVAKWSNCSSNNVYGLWDVLPKDDTWHQYYVAWRQGVGSVEVCMLRDDIDSTHCVWQDTTFALGTQFDGIELAGTTYHVDQGDQVWFDDLATASTGSFIPPPPTTCTQHCYSNVMFLPGIEGSRLYVPGITGENQIWEPDSLFGNDIKNLDLSNQSATDGVYAKEGGVIESFYGQYDMYKTFFGILDQEKNNKNINDWETIAYDWRLDYQKLLTGGNETSDGKIYYNGAHSATSSPYIIQELKRLAATSKTGKVTIIAHSNGGLLAKALLMQPGLAQYVDKVILVASPQLGTSEAVGSLLHGFSAGLPSPTSIMFNDADARYLSQSTPMAYNLLPSATYLQQTQQSLVTFDQNLTAWKSKYSDPFDPSAGIDTESGLKSFMTDTSRPVPSYYDLVDPAVSSSTLFDNAVAVHNTLDAWTPPQGVQLVTISGWGQPTLSSITYIQMLAPCSVPGASTKCASGPSISFDPNMSIEGDGTVQGVSASWANHASSSNYWVDLSQLNSSSATKYEHANIFEAPNVDTLLTSLITDAPTAFLPQYISTKKPIYLGNTPRLYFVLHSPLTLGFQDSSGNYTGASTASTTPDSFNVPGVEYERMGEVQWLSVPKSLAGKVVMRGTGSGSFALDIEEVNGDTTLATTTFAAVPCSTSTVASVTIDPTQSPTASSTLVVDLNGDGKSVRTLHAKQGGVALPDLTPPEVIISASTTTQDLVVTGVDDQSPTTTVTTSGNKTTITDQSGNTTTLTFAKTYSGKILTYARLTSIQYGAASSTPLPSSFLYVWDAKKNLLSQTVVVDNQFVVEALYDKTKNKTAIIVLKKNTQVQTASVAGLAIIKLSTSKGAITYSW